MGTALKLASHTRFKLKGSEYDEKWLQNQYF